MPTLPKSMKARFKIIGKCPTSATKYSLTGTVTKPGKVITQLAAALSTFFVEAYLLERPQTLSGKQPTAKTIILTITLP